MSFLRNQLLQLDLPAIPNDREELKRILLEKEYGVIPPLKCRVEGRIISEEDDFCAGKALLRKIELTLTLPGGNYSFPVHYCFPQGRKEYPLFIMLNFTPHVPDKYYPVEEICDRGYAVLSAGYNDVSPDAPDDYQSGLGKLLREAAADAGVPSEHMPGKIAIWAWTLSRMLDWALQQPGVNAEHTAVIGHSRLGKTALLAGMLDSRFGCVISNASGCSGAAITRGKPGEHVADITRMFPFWFCSEYPKFSGDELNMPFDQHWLLAAISPRLLCVGSAEGDEWAGPGHEFLSCVAASEAWEKQGKAGLVSPDNMPRVGDFFPEGNISYHLRSGKHYMSREDWNRYMDFLDSKGWQG